MKTILFIEEGGHLVRRERLLPSFEERLLFFQGFIGSGEVAVCPWNAAGETPHTAIPRLEELVAPNEEWRAVVVADLSFGRGCQRGTEFVFNPFDVAGAVPDPAMPEEPIALLARMLGGVPLRQVTHSHLYGQEGNGKEEAQEGLTRFPLPCQRPSELLLVSPRNIPQEQVWTFGEDQSERAVKKGGSDQTGSLVQNRDSRFWERGNYPDRARYVVIDRMRPAALPTNEDYLRFWLSVLLLATSSIDRSCLLPYSLHRLDIDVDFDALARMLGRRRMEAEEAADVVRMEIAALKERRESFTFTSERDLPLCRRDIYLKFDVVEQKNLFVQANRFGLAKDTPTPDEAEWDRQQDVVRKELKRLMREPHRALRAAAKRFRAEAVPLPDEELRNVHLTSYQTETLSEILWEKEMQLASSSVSLVFDERQCRKQVDERAAEVKGFMAKRPLARAVALAFGLAAVALLLGFLPYMAGLTAHRGFSLQAAGVSALCIALLLGVGFARFAWERFKLGKLFKAFNRFMGDLIEDLRQAAKRVGLRMSEYATFVGNYSLYRSQVKGRGIDPEEELLAGYAAQLKKIVSSCEADLETMLVEEERIDVVRRAVPSVSVREVKRRMESGGYRELPRADIRATCPLNAHVDAGLHIAIPYDIITGVRIEPLSLYE